MRLFVAAAIPRCTALLPLGVGVRVGSGGGRGGREGDGNNSTCRTPIYSY